MKAKPLLFFVADDIKSGQYAHFDKDGNLLPEGHKDAYGPLGRAIRDLKKGETVLFNVKKMELGGDDESR